MNFNIPVENRVITKYIQPLTEGRHGNFNRVQSNIHRGQAGEHQKDAKRGLSQAKCIHVIEILNGDKVCADL